MQTIHRMRTVAGSALLLAAAGLAGPASGQAAAAADRLVLHVSPQGNDNGQRRPRARIPDCREFLRTAGPVSNSSCDSFRFAEGDLAPWPDLPEALLVVYHSWETSLHHVASLDPEACTVTLREPAPWPMGRWENQQRYYVENVAAGLDAPGEWHLDPAGGRLRYFPLPGETIAATAAVAPRVVSTLVEFRGDPARNAFVEHLHFRGIAFRHTDAELGSIRNPGQGEVYQPALIQAAGLRQASFTDCEAAPTARITVDNCFIHDGSLYIDNLRLGTPEELAQPPKRRPRTPATPTPPDIQ